MLGATACGGRPPVATSYARWRASRWRRTTGDAPPGARKPTAEAPRVVVAVSDAERRKHVLHVEHIQDFAEFLDLSPKAWLLLPRAHVKRVNPSTFKVRSVFGAARPDVSAASDVVMDWGPSVHLRLDRGAWNGHSSAREQAETLHSAGLQLPRPTQQTGRSIGAAVRVRTLVQISCGQTAITST
jgi:hypothetical protein